MNLPDRRVYLDFHIDANRINAMNKLPYMNQLQKWKEKGVINIDGDEIALDEASKGSSARYSKASSYIYSKLLPADRRSEDYYKIKKVLFPNGFKESQDENDVLIVYLAKRDPCILITNDGGSKRQPGGILGNKDRLLKEIGVEVLRDNEAVALVRQKIKKRAERAVKIAQKTGKELPEWVGKD